MNFFGLWAVSLLLVSIRIGMVLAMTPILGAMSIPAVLRVLIPLGIAAAMTLALPVTRYRGDIDLMAIMGAAAIEVAVGAMLGLGVLFAFATFSVAGRLLDIQIGFGIAQLLDPATRQNVPLLTGVMTQLGVLCLFAMDVHHTLLRALAYSYDVFPAGEPWAIAQSLPVVIRHAGSMFMLAFALVAPVVTALLLVELGLSVLSRNLPQMNMFVLGMPIKVIVGVGALVVWIGVAGVHVSRIFDAIFHSWEALFR
ncbi:MULTISPECIES: flagellar biosynthetic protein FliR [unclassified Cupriavidus]|uniref:flagellar biosynthetic protein FliR n=1 Tax=Cupriavidus sp. H19C3 TaxID=3241603 RepID=UPI003BF8CAC2